MRTALDEPRLSLHMTFVAVSECRFIYRDIGYLLNEFPALEVGDERLT